MYDIDTFSMNPHISQVEIPVTALPGDQSVFQTDLDQGVAKLRVTPGKLIKQDSGHLAV